jgi:hypothetical protein
LLYSGSGRSGEPIKIGYGISQRGGQPGHGTAASVMADLDARVARAWLWLGCPILLCVLFWLLARAGWSGRFDPYAYNYGNIAGMVPHRDASDYFADALNLALTGRWAVIATRRPIAGAMRQFFALLGDYSYVQTVLIQAAAVAAMLWFCAYRLMCLRGALTGVLFLVLMLVLIEPFVGTFLTEPMALLWVLLSCVFFLESLAQGSKAFACLALATLTMAMLARMGALLFVPAFALWVVWSFGSSRRERALLVLYAGLAVGIPLALNAALAALYGDPDGAVGANFGYLLCELTHGPGKDFHFCRDLYRDTLDQLSERAQTNFLMETATEQAIAQPWLAFSAILHNAKMLVRWAPWFYLNGYMGRNWFGYTSTAVIGTIFLVLLTLYLARCGRRERLFWLFAFATIFASAVLVLQEDGRRALMVSHVYIVLVIACATTLRTANYRTQPLSASWCAGATTAGILAVGAAPSLSHYLFERGLPPRQTMSSSASKTILAGHRLTGFLVVPDNAPQSSIWPAVMTVSTFKQLMRSAPFEADFGPFLATLTGETSFAFISGLALEDRRMRTYIAPPDVFCRECWAIRAIVSAPFDGNDRIRTVVGFQRVYADCARSDSTVLQGPFQATGAGHGFALRLTDSDGDSNEKPSRSTLILCEDYKPLGPAHSLHEDIRTRGSGRYSHWGPDLIFSSSDGSDPNTNDRLYSYVP